MTGQGQRGLLFDPARHDGPILHGFLPMAAEFFPGIPGNCQGRVHWWWMPPGVFCLRSGP